MDDYFNKHYITVDDAGRITDGWSDGPHPGRGTATAICINDQGGYQFRLSPGGEENPALYGMDSIMDKREKSMKKKMTGEQADKRGIEKFR